MTKRMISSVLAIVMVLSLSITAFAASNYFSGITGKMNSLQGMESTINNISSGSVPSTAKVSGVTVTLQVSTGSSPFYLILRDPSGTIRAEQYVSGTGSKTVNFTQFNNMYPYGTWKMSILSTGTVSTATARMTVNYNY